MLERQGEAVSGATEAFFSPDYAAARERFRSAAARARARLETLAYEASGPQGEPLATDIAWLGAGSPARVLLHLSGVHGVEAFAGSAVQLAALAEPLRPPPGCALVLVHVVNPWGMAWLRRTNANNVDLNRNCLAPAELRQGAPPLYRRIEPLLNPSPSAASKHFLPHLLLAALRYGLRALIQAVAEGQYEYPEGLFYGGAALEPEPRALLEWLGRALAPARYVLALDLHTGLGRWRGDLLVTEPGAHATPVHALGEALGRELLEPSVEPGARRPYRIRGALGTALARELSPARVDYVLQEIGTYRALTVLAALREENHSHRRGACGPADPAKRRLLEALCPAAPAWRRRALALGLALLHAAAAWTFGRP